MEEKNPLMMVFLGDFIAKSKCLCTNDSKNFEDLDIGSLTSSFGFHQAINKPTHILNNSSSYIDLAAGVYSSLQANFHHQLLYVKFNLNVFYPPPYEREVWLYKLAIRECIRREIKNFV